MPENTDLPPVLQTFGDDLAAAMTSTTHRTGLAPLAWLAGLPRQAPRRFASITALAAALVAVVVALSLGGSRTVIAQAAVLERAATALEKPNMILESQMRFYNADGGGLTMALGGNGLGGRMCIPGPCARQAPATARTGISADPAHDKLTYSVQGWLSPNRTQAHAVYSNGDETSLNRTTEEYWAYDAADNTLTTLTDMDLPSAPPPPSTAPLSLELASAGATFGYLGNPSFYEQLYKDTQAADHTTVSGGAMSQTITTRLAGPTSIAGQAVYELRFDVNTTIRRPAGTNRRFAGACTATRCTLPESQILLYLGRQTYTPVRTVVITTNPHDIVGPPPGTTVTAVAEYSIHTLPDTPANQTLLKITPHPGAKHTQTTLAHYMHAHGLHIAIR
ncbi:MAG: hypothetical protein ABSG64_13325 [Solirubrobacteraceae bacterium]|jgi:hypothetical protein